MPGKRKRIFLLELQASYRYGKRKGWIGWDSWDLGRCVDFGWFPTEEKITGNKNTGIYRI